MMAAVTLPKNFVPAARTLPIVAAEVISESEEATPNAILLTLMIPILGRPSFMGQDSDTIKTDRTPRSDQILPEADTTRITLSILVKAAL